MVFAFGTSRLDLGMNENFYRSACARQHHIIGHYLAVQAWHRGLDCIVLDRVDLEFFFGLQRFKGTRVRWLMEDLRPWFPYQENYNRTGVKASIHSLFLARVPIAEHLPSGSMTTEQRIERMAEAAPKTAVFLDPKWLKVRPSEAEMLSQLMLLAAGVRTPDSFKPKPRVRTRPKATTSFVDPFTVFNKFIDPQKE